MTAKKFIEKITADIAQQQNQHEASMELVAMPGTTVYVLPDGRRNWMQGESGVVVWSDEELAEIQFAGRGLVKLQIKRISRQLGGKDCWQGRMESNFIAASNKVDRDF
jgi:hypothetical protein